MARRVSFIIFASVVVAGTGCGAEPVVGEQDAGSNHLVRMPAVGALLYDGQFYCTGTLIGPRQVATAARCVQGFEASRMAFAIGAEVSRPDLVLRVARAEVHPSFSLSRSSGDIGLAVLVEDAPVAPLPVLASMDESLVGEYLLFVGFGDGDGDDAAPARADRKRVAWIEVAELSPLFFRYERSSRNGHCGDAGGPALYRTEKGRYLLAGITTCADAGCAVCDVDTRADRYLEFLGVTGTPIEGDSSR
jgi:secreted trypsin-like serine protease